MLSKVLERDAFDQLLNFLETNSLLDPCQVCYRRGISTQTALIAVTDYIRKAVEESKLTVLILLDFSKAMPDLQHIPGHNEDGTITSWRRSASGVPQGSILGPLLFALYINDIPRILIRVLYMLYADDMQIY